MWGGGYKKIRKEERIKRVHHNKMFSILFFFASFLLFLLSIKAEPIELQSGVTYTNTINTDTTTYFSFLPSTTAVGGKFVITGQQNQLQLFLKVMKLKIKLCGGIAQNWVEILQNQLKLLFLEKSKVFLSLTLSLPLLLALMMYVFLSFLSFSFIYVIIFYWV